MIVTVISSSVIVTVVSSVIVVSSSVIVSQQCDCYRSQQCNCYRSQELVPAQCVAQGAQQLEGVCMCVYVCVCLWVVSSLSVHTKCASSNRRVCVYRLEAACTCSMFNV